MSLEIRCLFLLENSERTVVRYKNLIWTEIFFVHFRIFIIGIRNLALKHWFVHQIVEWILPYKMRYFSLFGFLIKHLNFCFLITFIFEKSIFRSKFISRRSSFSENTYSFTDIKARLEFNNPFCRTMSTQQNYHI